MLKIGIIGCGKIAQVRHLPEYHSNENAQLWAYYDINKERAAAMAGQYGGKAYESWQDLVGDPQIDCISVCSANHTHGEITVAALAAGKHVLCEKPMAVTLSECNAMVEAAQKSGKFLMIGHNQRFAKAHIKAKELIQEGVIGQVISFRTTFGHGGPESWSIEPGKNTWFFDKNKAAMGAMADLGIHKTDLIHFLTGSVVTEATAQVVTVDKKDASGELIGVDDNAICIYKLDNGAIGTMTASWTFYGPEDNSTVLYGTKGIMRIYDHPEYSLQVFLNNGDKIYYDIDKIQTNDNQTKSGVIDAFVDCVIKGRQPEISGKEAIKAMRAVFACLESSKTGRSVKIDQI